MKRREKRRNITERSGIRAGARSRGKAGTGRNDIFSLVALMLAVSAAVWLFNGSFVVRASENAGTEAAEGIEAPTLSEEEKKLLEETAQLLEEGNMEFQGEIRGALDEAEARLGITFTDAQKEKLSSLLEKAGGLGTDSDALLDKVQSLYGSYGEELMENVIQDKLVEPVQEAAAAKAEAILKDFFRTMGENIREFFASIF